MLKNSPHADHRPTGHLPRTCTRGPLLLTQLLYRSHRGCRTKQEYILNLHVDTLKIYYISVINWHLYTSCSGLVTSKGITRLVTLVQVILSFCQSDTVDPISVKFQTIYKSFLLWNCISKFYLQNVSHFVQMYDVQYHEIDYNWKMAMLNLLNHFLYITWTFKILPDKYSGCKSDLGFWGPHSKLDSDLWSNSLILPCCQTCQCMEICFHVSSMQNNINWAIIQLTFWP